MSITCIVAYLDGRSGDPSLMKRRLEKEGVETMAHKLIDFKDATLCPTSMKKIFHFINISGTASSDYGILNIGSLVRSGNS